VDPKARREFWNHIHFLSEQGITTLVSTHYMDEAERCHRVAYISSGKILTTGTIDEVIENAKLSLWTVTGKNTKGLADRIKTMPSVSHVTPFGKIFHVIGYDSETLEKDISKFGENDLIWQKAIPSIEDVFISLITDPGSIS
jgi:ABC-2 type transport system ATP-binding protein